MRELDGVTDTSNPDEVASFVQQHGRRDVEGQRAYARYVWRTRVALFLGHPAQGDARETFVSTCDLSAAGFSFEWTRFAHVDTVVYVRFENLPHRPFAKGVVRHCEYLGNRRHRVGVQFVPFTPSEAAALRKQQPT